MLNKIVFALAVVLAISALGRKIDKFLVIESQCEFKPVFHLANLFARTSKKRMLLCGDVVSVCRQPIKLLLSLFARTNSPSRKPALDVIAVVRVNIMSPEQYFLFN